jgi:hypothetical protein
MRRFVLHLLLAAAVLMQASKLCVCSAAGVETAGSAVVDSVPESSALTCLPLALQACDPCTGKPSSCVCRATRSPVTAPTAASDSPSPDAELQPALHPLAHDHGAQPPAVRDQSRGAPQADLRLPLLN